MRIRSADVIALKIPFTDGSSGVGLMPAKWTHLDVVMVRLETTDGVVGWGDAFAYSCARAVSAALTDMVLPLVLDREIDDVAALNLDLQKKLHLHGRYGLTVFAISAVDIALWDIAAKEQGQSLSAHLGRKRDTAPAYASLVRYGDPGEVREYAARSVSEGYDAVKLHEIAGDCIAAGREGAGAGVKLATDVNCNWSLAEAEALMPRMKELDLYWVEEPVFPPDDEIRLGDLQTRFDVFIASGENACTSVEFARLAPRIRFLQPSVTKVGGVSEFLRICDLAEGAGAAVMPHSPYFGPGYWATAQLMAARPVCEMFEMFYIKPEAFADPGIALPAAGAMQIPDRPGIGFEPDPEVLKRYQA